MSDITKHKWSSTSLIGCEVTEGGNIDVEMDDDAFWLSKDDAIAIAKHFKITDGSSDIKRLREMQCRKDSLIKRMCVDNPKALSVAREVAGGGLDIIFRNADE